MEGTLDVEARSLDAVRAPRLRYQAPREVKSVNPSPKGEPAEAKKPKAESREAEGPPEALEEEMVAGLPTVHDCMLVAALPTEAEEKEVKFYDERTGEALETSEVYKGREKELTKMESFNVKNDITYAEAKAKGLRLVRSGARSEHLQEGGCVNGHSPDEGAQGHHFSRCDSEARAEAKSKAGREVRR